MDDDVALDLPSSDAVTLGSSDLVCKIDTPNLFSDNDYFSAKINTGMDRLRLLI
jgi:hypothetical protein